MSNVYFDLTAVVEEQVSDEMISRLAERLRQIGVERDDGLPRARSGRA